MTIDEFLDKLEGVSANGSGYKAVCPSHEDREASLQVTEREDGSLGVYCHAGCDTTNVMKSLGLGMSDLFPNARRHDQLPEAVYAYADEFRDVLFEAVRMPGKRFMQRHYDPDHPDAKDDGYVYNLEGVRRVVFRLPELIEAIKENRTIYIVEGEKDALRLAQEGYFATCNPMGAGKWRDEYTSCFVGAKQVIIIQDRDEPGRRHAKRVREALEALGITVFTFQSKVGKDVSDHFDAGFKIEDLVRPRATPKRGIVTSSEIAESMDEYLTYRPTDLPGYALIPGVEASIVRPGRLYACGAYTGDGKTTYALQGARALAQQGVRVGYFSMEMSESDLRNRLVAHRGVPMRLLERPWELRANPEILGIYQAAKEEIRDWKLDIIYDTSLKVERVVEITIDREYEFVVIDHVHRLGFSDRRHLEEQVKILTNLTLDANIPMLVLCQLRRYQRGKDMASYPPPVLQDFRETEVLGNEASIAMAVWRQRDQEGLRYMGDASQFRVLKNRHTTSRHDKAGHIEMLNFNPVTQLFSPGGISSAFTEEESAQSEAPLDPTSDVWG